MIIKEIKCNGCNAKIEVTTWKKFVICPYCRTKNSLSGFDYKRPDPDSSMMAHVRLEQDCPSCRSPHMYAHSILSKWRCFDCGYTIPAKHKLFGVFWFCDNCETYMNIQPGFTTKNKKWTCTECGFLNSVTRKDIL